MPKAIKTFHLITHASFWTKGGSWRTWRTKTGTGRTSIAWNETHNLLDLRQQKRETFSQSDKLVGLMGGQTKTVVPQCKHFRTNVHLEDIFSHLVDSNEASAVHMDAALLQEACRRNTSCRGGGGRNNFNACFGDQSALVLVTELGREDQRHLLQWRTRLHAGPCHSSAQLPSAVKQHKQVFN